MNVLIFGATGMVGSGVLLECLANPDVRRVVVVGRSSVGMDHPKLTEHLVADVRNLSGLDADLSGIDACFFCLGVSSMGMSEAEYTRLTFDLTLAVARKLADVRPSMTFTYVSGAGTDASERGRIMWARVKGRTENALSGLPFAGVYHFRPGYIQPVRGVRSKTTLYRVLYEIVGPLYPLLRRLFPKQVTDSRSLGRAMLRVAKEGYSERILETGDINSVGARGVVRRG